MWGDLMPRCDVCHNHCELEEGQTGICRARKYENGEFVDVNYGFLTSMALDPIEKKPLRRFFPGSLVLSVGSYGCNLRCPFCQNHEISYGFGKEYDGGVKYFAPDELVEIAEKYRDQGNIGIAFTYNEPLIGYEYIVDTSLKVHKRGMKTVLVSNGSVSERIADMVLPHIDAANIDLKAFTDEFYEKTLSGNRRMVMDFISKAAGICHLEVTTLIIPGLNDSDDEMLELSEWLSNLDNGSGAEKIALHISRYFPQFKMDIPATDVEKIYHLAELARKNLRFVYTGNC